jgi:hypothetical protein
VWPLEMERHLTTGPASGILRRRTGIIIDNIALLYANKSPLESRRQFSRDHKVCSEPACAPLRYPQSHFPSVGMIYQSHTDHSAAMSLSKKSCRAYRDQSLPALCWRELLEYIPMPSERMKKQICSEPLAKAKTFWGKKRSGPR